VPRAPPATITAHREGPRRPIAAADPALDADRPAVLDQDPASLDPGPEPRPGRDRPRQVADVHPALRVDRTPVGAGAALDAAARVAGDRAAAGADRRRARHRQPAVAAHPVGVERRHAQHLLGLGEVGVELGRPGDPEPPRPAVEHRLRGAEAGARVDHRGAADDLRHRDHDRGPARRDRQATFAEEAADCPQLFAGIAVAVVVAAGLEHQDVEPGLGQRRRGDRAAGAGADDHDIAFLALGARLGVAERACRLGDAAVGEPAADLVADPRPHLRRHRVAERREQLRHQQQVDFKRPVGALQPLQEPFAPALVHVAEAARERQPLEGAEAEAQLQQQLRWGGAQELGDRPGDVDLALGARQAVDPRRHRPADRAQGPAFGPSEAWRAGARFERAIDPSGEDVEPERRQDQRAVDQGAQQVGEDVALEQEEGQRGARGGGLAGGEEEQQRPVADDVGLGDHADAGDHNHVGEAERQPEVLLRVGRPGVVAEDFAEVRHEVERGARQRDVEEADNGEGDREQAQGEDDESFRGVSLHEETLTGRPARSQSDG
jgi:hypothetical protein